MTESETITPAMPTSEERAMAALAHGSVVLSFLGALVPALIWATHRRKSPFVAFHALQAAGYQMLTFWLGLAAYLGFILLIFILLIPFSDVILEQSGENPAGTAMQIQWIVSLVFYGFILLYSLLGIAGAIFCLTGRDFKYPFLGKRLETYLGRGADFNSPLDETKEDRWMSAIGHASAILLLWGLFMPLVVLFVQKDSSPRLRFQSAQAAVYQTIATIMYFGFGICYIGAFFALLASAVSLPNLGAGGDMTPLMTIALLVFLLVFLVLGIFVMLGLPTYHLFAMIAGIQVLKGREYRYPLLGNFIARRLKMDEPKG